ncbi:zinc finger protein OZF-like [Wyeomyia smithii]|uniref:zinc finger protein OZF-like n=1 Tax=Wyeomyia smithii TaxID=174621 RepID=UPI002467D528|nr:zinc finger protein OZF-like [Wyeomyia smithii]
MSETRKLTDTCRTCMQNATNAVSIFDPLEETTIACVVTECTAVQITDDQLLPNLICENCLKLLNSFVGFIKKVKETDKLLRKLFKQAFEVKLIDLEEFAQQSADLLEDENQIKLEDYSDNPLDADVFAHSTRSKKPGRKPKPKLSVEPDVMDDLEAKTFDRVEIPSGHFVCCACFKSYSTLDALTEHGESTHRKNPPPDSVKRHFCEICFRGYLTRRAIKEHREKVQRMTVYECKICQMRHVNCVKRRNHAHNHDKKANIVTEEIKATLGKLCCAINCNCSFPTDELLMQHARTVHKFNKIEADIGFNQDRPIGCDICHKHFSTEKGLQQHRIRKYLPKRHQCSMCGEKFHSPSDLILHERIHRNEKNVPCEICPKRFYTAQQLKDHIRKHAAVPRFVCNLCGKAFKQNKILHAHLLAHENRLPYVCDVCNKGFRVKNKLTYHMRTHTGERPYPCRHCDAAFADSTNRMRHELIHMKQKNQP